MAVAVFDDFSSRLEAFQEQDDKRTQWMRSMHQELSDITEKYQNVCRDLEREKIAGRGLQTVSKQWEGRFDDLTKSIAEKSFVLVLLDADADAYMFKPEYYSRPGGGQKAAHDLQAALKQYIGQTMPELSGLPIVLKAFANADGLADVLVRSRVTRTPKGLWDFAMSFSQACETFDFVLVGSGKDRADEKIKELLKLFFGNPTCRHVIFGACHDNGYVRSLERLTASEEAKERLTLLESFQVGWEYRSLGIKKSAKMESIFRTECLSAPASPVPSSATTVGRSSTASSISESNAANQAVSWARAAALQESVKHGGSNSSTTSVARSRKFVDLPKGTILVNAQNQRVDAELPPVLPSASTRWFHRKIELGMRFCRVHHLSGECFNKPCQYSHDPLPEREKVVFRELTRRQRCHVGSGCRDQACFYGHHCSCEGRKCNFQAAQHGIDVASAGVWKGD